MENLTEQQKLILSFAKQFENTISNNFVASQKKNIFSKRFNQETVAQFLANPQKNEQSLRELSMILTTISPQYNQIVSYLASICKFSAVITPNLDKFSDSKGNIKDTEKIRKEYLKAVNYLETMNIQHEMSRIVHIICRDDVFYGYIHKTNNSFYIQQLDPEYCRIKYVLDGCFFFEMDMSYFDKNNNLKDIEGRLIDNYPEEFKKGYNDYLRDKTNNKWLELDEKNCICIKYNETLPFSFPPFASLYSELSSLEDYKNLMKSKTEIDNYKLIGLEIPLLDSDKEDDLAVSVSTAMSFYNMINGALPSGVGAFLSPMKATSYSFANATMSDKDQISKAEDSLYNSSSFSSVVFGKNANTSTGLKTSNLIDSAKCYTIYRQIERWLNHHFKNEFNEKFIVKLLDVTVHTIDQEIDKLYKLATMGVPVKLQLASLVVSQAVERGSVELEKILGLQEDWMPLNSSFVQSSKGTESGRPESDNPSEATEITRDRDDNVDK